MRPGFAFDKFPSVFPTIFVRSESFTAPMSSKVKFLGHSISRFSTCPLLSATTNNA